MANYCQITMKDGLKKAIYLLEKITHRISKLRTFVYKKKDIKSNVI